MGIAISDYWNMTPRTFSIIVDGFKERKEQELKQQQYLVWLGENLHRTKYLKPFNQMFKDESQEEMTDKQMLSKVKILNAMFGGEVKSNGSS
jgi:hypothetical protein